MSKVARNLLKSDFAFYPGGHINWFPGHMRKATRQLTTQMNKIDLFIEVRDSRIPFTSHNILLDELIPNNKKRVVVYNKADLAIPEMTEKYLKFTREVEKYDCFEMSAKKHIQVDRFINHIKHKINPKFSTIGNWMMIGGNPNVGKSTIINMLRMKEDNIEHSRKSGARVGAVPWITRSITGFKVMTDPLTYLIDTPGITQPKILHNEDGLRLCSVGSIRDGIIDHEVTLQYILYKLNKNKVKKYVDFYKWGKPAKDLETLMRGAKKRYGRMSHHNLEIAVMKDFREGKLGRITMDEDPEIEVERRKQVLEEIEEKKLEREYY